MFEFIPLESVGNGPGGAGGTKGGGVVFGTVDSLGNPSNFFEISTTATRAGVNVIIYGDYFEESCHFARSLCLCCAVHTYNYSQSDGDVK